MRKMRPNLPLILLGLVTAGLLIVFGCGDDGGDPVGGGGGGGGGGGTTYDDPNGEYNVTSSNVSVTIVGGDLPPELSSFVEPWIEDILGGGGSSTCEVSQQLLLVLKTESPVCAPIPYAYDEETRSCTQPSNIDVEEIDVSALGLCVEILLVEHCVDTVSIDAEVTPNLTWASGFATFSGSEAIGSAQQPASMTVVISGTLLGGTYNIQFHASRNVSATRCTDCATCPAVPVGSSPNGNWDVTSTNVNVTVTDSDLPSQLNSFIEEWLGDIISNGGTSEWSVAQAAVILTRTETEMCAPMPYAYDPISRRCTISTPLDVSDVDVSGLNLCKTVLLVEYCLTEVSLDADFTPDLQWAPDFESFSGSEMIGSAQTPATTTVVVTGPVLGGEYSVEFYSSRNVSGTRCSGCTPCQ